jgi:aspartyl-tRNA(Asn)/glutamyl-tRNA(Gln) amidotransferase subunit A
LENQEVANAVLRATDRLSACGITPVSAALPSPTEALAAYYVLSSAEASSNLARFDGVRYGRRSAESDTLTALYENSRREGLGAEVKRRILFGTYVLSVGNREDYYLRACDVREKIKRRMAEQFETCNLLILPTAPTTAFCLGEYRTPKQMYEADLCTVYASLAGYPAISVPFGKDGNGLPLAVQLIAPPMCEERLLATAKALEEGMA